MRKLTTCVLFCVICFSSEGQVYRAVLENGKPKIFDWPVMMTRVYFNIADSIYDYTLFREPDGLFYFGQGFDHVDDSLSMVMSPIVGEHKRKDTLEVKTYKPSFHWTANEIRSTSRFMPFITGPESFINTYEEEYDLTPFVNELIYTTAQDSLHLQDISKVPASDVIRLTRIDGGFHGPVRIQFYEIDLDDDADPKIRYIETMIDSSMKCRTTLDLDFRLNRRDAKAFIKSLHAAENEEVTYFTKTNLNKPFLIEVRRGDKYTVLARSTGFDPERQYQSSYCGFLWNVERFRKRYEKKQAKQ